MTLLDIIIIILVLSWIGGLSFGVGGSLINLLVVIAIIMLIFRLLGRGRNNL